MTDNKNVILINNNEYEVVSYITIPSGNFIVYTDNKVSDDGQILLYINRVSQNGSEVYFDEIDSDETNQVISALKERLVSNE